jgi:hypothetical protein
MVGIGLNIGFDVLVQFAGLVALIIGVWLGYRRWVKPRVSILNLQSKGLLVLLILTFMGGLIGSTGWWFDHPSSFAWDLPTLASRMLANAGWAFGAANFMVLEHLTGRRVRLALLMLLTYLLPLAIAIVLFHLDRFNFNEPISYAFFIFVIGMIVPCLWYLFRQPTIEPDTARDSISSDNLTRIWFTLIAVVMTIWGLALFATDSGTDLIWLWAGDALTSRLIAVMLLTIAVAAIYSRNHADTARITHVVILVYGFGVIASNIANLLENKPMKFAYVVVFGVAALVSVALLTMKRNQPA